MDDQANNEADIERPATEEAIEQSLPPERQGQRRYRFELPSQQKRSLPQLPQLPHLPWWREALLGLLLTAAVLFLVNPFSAWAMARAEVAQTAQPLAVTPPIAPEQGYCITGNFLDWNGSDTLLLDDGTEGDVAAGDGIYARTLSFAEPGQYAWRVLPCGQWDTAVPERGAWVFVDEPNQAITFTFNPNLPQSDFWPPRYALVADDNLPDDLVAVGSFQTPRWNNQDPLTLMEAVADDLYQLVYTVPVPGNYDAYISIWGSRAGIGASGRSIEPIPLNFTTQLQGETVVIQYDAQTNRIAVFSGIPWLLTWLGFNQGALWLAGFFLLGSLVTAVWVGYRRVVFHPDKQHLAGCAVCGHTPLKRINRKPADYWLNLVGIPVRRYKCTECGWEGRRMKP